MSDTSTVAGQDTLKLPGLPNWSVKPMATAVNGRPERRLEVTYGEPMRSVQVVQLSMLDLFDLLETTGHGNEMWRNMCQVAASVRAIDGIPLPTGKRDVGELRDVVDRLGADGLRAVMEGLNDPTWALVTASADVAAAAKN